MCLAIPGKVISIIGRKAVVDYGDCQNPAIIDVDTVHVGDMVHVQMGIIVRILTPEEAVAAQSAWAEVLAASE